MERIRTIIRDATGATAVEMALVLPLVLLLTFGTIEVALFMYHSNAAQKAAELGARWATVNAPISTNLKLDIADTTWWSVGSFGESCHTVTGGCQPNTGDVYKCKSGSADCTMTGILTVMQRAYPDLQAADILVQYAAYNPATEHVLGFVGRPGGIPMKVTVTICKQFQFSFLSVFVGAFPNPDAPGECNTELNKPDGFYTPARTTLVTESFGPPPSWL